MGRQRDGMIEDFQRQAGIQPASPAQRQTLIRLSQLTVQLVQVIALEESGIRDGDGYWSGCGPIDAIIATLVEVGHGERRSS